MTFCRKLLPILACMSLVLTLFSGCPKYKQGNRVGSTSPVLANEEPLYEICMNRCKQPGDLANFTRVGCEETCNDLRRNFKYLDYEFANYKSCAKALNNLSLNRDLYINNRQAQCYEDYTHLHDLQGCKDAVTAFYAAATLENVCGGAYTPHTPTTAQPVIALPAEAQPLPEPLIKDMPKYDTRPRRSRPAPKAQAKPAEAKPALPAPLAPAPEQKDTPYPPAALIEPQKDAPTPEVKESTKTEPPAKPVSRGNPSDENYDAQASSGQIIGSPGQPDMAIQPGNSIITGQPQPIFTDVPPASPDRSMIPSFKRQDSQQEHTTSP